MKTNEHLDESTLSAVMKEMAKPRLAVSVRDGVGKAPIKTLARFRIGALLRNRDTKEDGLVKRIYKVSGGVVMYEVSVRAVKDSHYISDWAEGALDLSTNATPLPSDKPPRGTGFTKRSNVE
jgi:hypothetical protein